MFQEEGRFPGARGQHAMADEAAQAKKNKVHPEPLHRTIMSDTQPAASSGNSQPVTSSPGGSAFANVPFTFTPPTGSTGANAFPTFAAPAGKDAEEDDEELPPEVKARVDYLKELSGKRESLLEQYRSERAALENKYNALFAPIYEKRADVVAGRIDVKAAEGGGFTEVEGFTSGAAAPEAAAPAEEGKAAPKRGIPDFWLQAMVHHDVLQAMLAEEDIPALSHLTDIRCIDREDHKGFKLEFHFSPNPFFSNSVLSKSYDIPNMLEDSEPTLNGVEGTAIEWLPGKNLTVKEQKVRPKGKRGGPPVIKQVAKESFFNFFTALPMPDEDAEDEEEFEEQMNRIEYDYQLAVSFRLQLIPEAITFYEGGEEEEEDDDEEDDDEEDEDDDDEDDEAEEEDEDDDEDDDEEEEEEQHRPPTRGSRRHPGKKGNQQGGNPQPASGAAGGPGTQGEQQECKQS